MNIKCKQFRKNWQPMNKLNDNKMKFYKMDQCVGWEQELWTDYEMVVIHTMPLAHIRVYKSVVKKNAHIWFDGTGTLTVWCFSFNESIFFVYLVDIFGMIYKHLIESRIRREKCFVCETRVVSFPNFHFPHKNHFCWACLSRAHSIIADANGVCAYTICSHTYP